MLSVPKEGIYQPVDLVQSDYGPQYASSLKD